MLNYYRALRERDAPVEPARIAAPTLILWAEEDSFLERHVAEAGLRLWNDGQPVLVEGATHWLHIEQAEKFNTRCWTSWQGEFCASNGVTA